MIGEIKYFRKHLFGGFNERDVIEYIKRLAEERNRFLEEKEAAEDRVAELFEEVTELRKKVQDTEQNERRLKERSLEQAAKALAELETRFISALAEMRTAADDAGAELGKVSGVVRRVPDAFKKTEATLAELRMSVDIARDPYCFPDGGSL